MAKKTKDLEEKTKKTTTKKTTVAKKETVEKNSTTKKSVVSKKTKPKKESTTKKTVSAAKKSPVQKKAAQKKAVEKKTTAKKITKKTTTKSSKTKVAKDIKKEFNPEYYDLPYGYNKTVVKVLAQTPKVLFVYWEISEADRKSFIKRFGEDFFERTKPVLIVYNHTMNYSFEIDINDFANSWYIHINDSNCHYTVELGRKPIPFINSFKNEQSSSAYIPYYIYITSSNQMDAPNNHILYNFGKQITFRNVKTGEMINKDINNFKFITNLGIMNIAELYKLLYPGEDFDYDSLLNNPLSGLNSSGTFSSRFK